MIQGFSRNAQSNGVGWKGIADVLRENRPKIGTVAADYERTVVDADGLISTSTATLMGAATRADIEARRIMKAADDRFQRIHANTCLEPPRYKGPGDTGKAYQPSRGPMSTVDTRRRRLAGEVPPPVSPVPAAPPMSPTAPGGEPSPADSPRPEFPSAGPLSTPNPIEVPVGTWLV